MIIISRKLDARHAESILTEKIWQQKQYISYVQDQTLLLTSWEIGKVASFTMFKFLADEAARYVHDLVPSLL